MPKTPWNVAIAARPRGRPRKNPCPTSRFAPIRLTEVCGAPMSAAFELTFPGGLTLRRPHDADPAALERLLAHLRRQGE